MKSFNTECCSWWECSGDELWTMNLEQCNVVAQCNEFHLCGGNQALRKPYRHLHVDTEMKSHATVFPRPCFRPN